MRQECKFFSDQVGNKVVATSEAYTGEMTIENHYQACWCCSWAQNHGYKFTALPVQSMQDKNSKNE